MNKLMNNEMLPRNWEPYLLYVSFLPFLVKGISYWLVGPPYLFFGGIAIIFLILYFVRFRQSGARKAVKWWGLLLIAYGILRWVMTLVIYSVGDSVESVIVYQLSIGYHSMSVVLIILGYLVLKKSPQICRALG